MLFMLINRTRSGLAAADYAELATRAKAFYAAIPAEVKIHGEWAAADQSHNYAVIEAPDITTLQRLQQPFERFTDTQIVPINAIQGWTAS
ncbi:DUF3303 domain-containing protein [Pseudorhodoferax sp.]|jgi:hypothetical protein|uniref:DUF3303 domain-containing protein n=1 Tax=Pseudorhodoferax sp. TaxID=1993553 RepID=UPI002DD6B1D6|nr:DUF3303 family protein [Pseudorhodoferax sp.]